MGSMKLLVVDDEADIADFVANVAERMDFEVLSTGDPSEFSSLLSTDHDVVVLDLFMPGMDGIELLRFLSDKKSHASIIFMSGKDKSVLLSAQQLALEQGLSVLGTLQKPFYMKELKELLLQYVPQPFTKPTHSRVLPTVDELRYAVTNEELFLAYQPQINIENRTVTGVEALARWKHPTKGMIPPIDFIPLAEEHNLISDITSFVIREAIRQQVEWKENGIFLRMSVNMSPKNLDELDMPERLAAYVTDQKGHIPDITIEVTETAIMSDTARYMDILARLRMKGFNLSIDDFGTGYSSLQQLVRVPFTELKIDQSFVRNLNSNHECKTITEISILLAHKLGIHVVAEGIEDEMSWNTLQELGCDEGQGYWMGRPMPAEDIQLWLDSWNKEWV